MITELTNFKIITLTKCMLNVQTDVMTTALPSSMTDKLHILLTNELNNPMFDQ